LGANLQRVSRLAAAGLAVNPAGMRPSLIAQIALIAPALAVPAAAQPAPKAPASAPAPALPSLCAAVPESGQIAAPGPRETRAPRTLPDRRSLCPPGWLLDAQARPPACARSAQKLTPGQPRAACLAGLPLGPIAPLPTLWRPTPGCAQKGLPAIVRLEGPGAGLGDVQIDALPAAGIAIETLASMAEAVPPEANPAVQGCHAPSCRLLRITISAAAADGARLRLMLPSRDPVTVPLRLESLCPDPLAR
jgi:hypothetical protein